MIDGVGAGTLSATASEMIRRRVGRRVLSSGLVRNRHGPAGGGSGVGIALVGPVVGPQGGVLQRVVGGVHLG